jgi:hypothetical protein
VSVRNCVELSFLARSVDPSWTGKYNRMLGLAHLSEIYLERLLPKGRITRSDWEAELSDKQRDCTRAIVFTATWSVNKISYSDAANDAHAGYMIYTKLASKVTEMVPVPDPDCYTFHVLEGLLRDVEGRPWFPFNPNYDPGKPELVTVNARTAAAIQDDM